MTIMDNYGWTPLIVAIEQGAGSSGSGTVRAFLNGERGSCEYIQNRNGNTALIWASYYKGHFEVLRALLNDERVVVNIQDRFGDIALIYASKLSHLTVVRALLNHKHVDLNIRNKSGFFYGRTALDVASDEGQYDAVRLLQIRMESNKGHHRIYAPRRRSFDMERPGNHVIGASGRMCWKY